ncbi:MAG: D-3-phosphoglycerate dehydrogenase [Saprospiraceae bacterium]|jgi:D-3-phosphoglycerate dehydrogenase
MVSSYPKDRIKVLLLEGIHQNAVKVFQDAGYTNIELLSGALPESELIKKIKDVSIVGIRSKTQLTKSVLTAAEKLWGVACFCIGTNQVDLKTAAQQGKVVFNSPYSNTRSVAELVIAEIIFLMRGISQKNTAAHQKVWLKSANNSNEVRGKKLGIIGYGHIGTQVSVLAEAIGMHVIYYDVIPKLPMGNARAVESLEQLLKESDVVSLHVPSTPETKYMIKKAELEAMKEGSYLINLSRGNVVEIDALKAALESKHILGAAVDVFPVEPKTNNDPFYTPLQGLSNVILTPHIGGSTQEAQENIGLDAAQKLINYLDNGSTVGSHSVPDIHLPKQAGTHRILHIHKNIPGVMTAINNIISREGLNVVGQYLKTNEDVGYVVLDIRGNVKQEIVNELKSLPETIKARVLY